ncbi:50S ribosomal protein L18e [archaeon SCG-AAA382B04]|nr:50S ribosomal protein L18e [archaeon SCG-AAA382B04]
MYGKNKRIKELISDLKDLSREEDVKIWRDIAERLKKPTKNYSEVNLSKINRNSKEGDEIIVPGKVLGSGQITKEITIASLSFSETAEQKIKQRNGNPLTIEELMKENPQGTEVKIIG